MLSNIHIDAVLSDPLLLVGFLLFVLGPIGFLFALVKYISASRKQKAQFVIPAHAPEPEEPASNQDNFSEYSERSSVPHDEKPGGVDSSFPHSPSESFVHSQDQNVSSQLEILFSHLKSLTHRLEEMEQQIELLNRHKTAMLSPNKLKEPPMDPADFTNKLLKLAEHIIVMEKELAKLKSERAGESKAPPSSVEHSYAGLSDVPSEKTTKPPIMPI